MTTIQELETKAKQLMEEIEQLKREEEKEEWPKVGDEYLFFYIKPMRAIFEDCKESVDRKDDGNMFRTKIELQNARLRVQSIETCKWRPKIGDKYFSCSFKEMNTYGRINSGFEINLYDFMIGNCHQTKEENEEWYAKFGKAWEEKIK